MFITKKMENMLNLWLNKYVIFIKFSDIAWKVLGFNADGSFDIKNGCYISIGCRAGKLKKSSFEKILEKDDTEKWNTFEKIYSEIYKKKSTNRYSLYKFLFEFKIGDYIVIPGNKTFNVFQIESELFFKSWSTKYRWTIMIQLIKDFLKMKN